MYDQLKDLSLPELTAIAEVLELYRQLDITVLAITRQFHDMDAKELERVDKDLLRILEQRSKRRYRKPATR
jgi:hypothetical protein